MGDQKILAVIVGPTAIGKTGMAIQLAGHYQTQILSADSRQIFRELNIGVARPSQKELDAVRHHFIATHSIHEDYNAGMFQTDAIQKIDALHKEHQVVICCGGSMLYLDAITKGLNDLPSDKQVRERLIGEWKNFGLDHLVLQLQELDPSYASTVDKSNPHRIIRALEVCMASGKKYSDLRSSQYNKRDFATVMFGLTANRDWIYSRIDRRVDAMIEGGLEEEARGVYPFRHLNALNTVGYKEMFSYFDGEMSLQEAIEKIKQHTRNFAKRQMTWWKNDDRIHWIEIDREADPISLMVSRIDSLIRFGKA